MTTPSSVLLPSVSVHPPTQRLPLTRSNGTSSSINSRSTGDSSVPTPLPISRPKRGRRKKRPDLTDTQRKALRALQNRQATRRSRERTRARAELLKSQLSQSLRENSLLQAERDRLLAHVKAGKGGVALKSRNEFPLRARGRENDVRGLVQKKQGCGRRDRRVNPMSLDVILNHDAPVRDDRSWGGRSLQYVAGMSRLGEEALTPPSKRFSAERTDCDTSPVSIASPSTARLAFLKKVTALSA